MGEHRQDEDLDDLIFGEEEWSASQRGRTTGARLAGDGRFSAYSAAVMIPPPTTSSPA